MPSLNEDAAKPRDATGCHVCPDCAGQVLIGDEVDRAEDGFERRLARCVECYAEYHVVLVKRRLPEGR